MTELQILLQEYKDKLATNDLYPTQRYTYEQYVKDIEHRIKVGSTCTCLTGLQVQACDYRCKGIHDK